MAEYIEREAVLDLRYHSEKHQSWVIDACDVEDLEAADVVEVKHGEWVGLEYDGYADGCPVYDLWECSECGEEVRGEDVPDTHPWCHGCGARMDGE